MASKVCRPITEAEIREYEENGAICLRQIIEPEWIDKMREVIDALGNDPGPRRIEAAEKGKGRFFAEGDVWKRHPLARDFLFNSPSAAIGAALLRSKKVNLLYDQMLVKEPGTDVPTSWHQDGASWPVHGENLLTIWIGLDEVTLENGGMSYVKGGHRGKRYGSYVNVVKHTPNAVGIKEDHCPDFFQEPDVELLHWDVKPGDVLIHHMWMPHGATGNLHGTRRRRAYTVRWAAEDTRFREGNFQFRLPPHATLKDGDPLDSEFFPSVAVE